MISPALRTCLQKSTQLTRTIHLHQDVCASITSQVAFYDVARHEHMSLEYNTADTADTPPAGYDVVCKQNMQSPEYETVQLAKAGKRTFTTSENPPPLPPPMIKGDNGLDNDAMLTEETTSTSQAKDEPTEDGGDGGQEHQYMLVEHKPSDKVVMKDSSKVIYSEVDKDKLVPVVPPPVAKTQGQYIPVETKPTSSSCEGDGLHQGRLCRGGQEQTETSQPERPTSPSTTTPCHQHWRAAHREDTSHSWEEMVRVLDGDRGAWFG